MTFDKDYCRTNCLPTGCYQATVHRRKAPLPRVQFNDEKKDKSETTTTKGRVPRKVGAAAFYTLAKRHSVEIFSLYIHEIDGALKLQGAEPPQQPLDRKIRYSTTTPKNLSNAQKMFRELHAPETTLHGQNEGQNEDHRIAASMLIAGFSLEDIQIALQTKERPDPGAKLPHHYHRHLPAFDYKAADTLPLHRPCDHKIDLKPGTTPPFSPLYNISIEELRVLYKFLVDNPDHVPWINRELSLHQLKIKPNRPFNSLQL